MYNHNLHNNNLRIGFGFLLIERRSVFFSNSITKFCFDNGRNIGRITGLLLICSFKGFEFIVSGTTFVPQRSLHFHVLIFPARPVKFAMKYCHFVSQISHSIQTLPDTFFYRLWKTAAMITGNPSSVKMVYKELVATFWKCRTLQLSGSFEIKFSVDRKEILKL